MRVRDHTHRRTHTVVAVASLESGRKSHSPISYLLRIANTHAHKQKPLYTVSHVYMRTPSMCMCECILNQSAQTCVNWRLVRLRCVVCAPQQHDGHRHHTYGGGSAHTHTITLANGSVNTLSLCRTRRRLELHCARPYEWCEFYAHRMLAQHTARIFRYVCTLHHPPWLAYVHAGCWWHAHAVARIGRGKHQQRTLPVHRSRA